MNVDELLNLMEETLEDATGLHVRRIDVCVDDIV